MGKEYFFSGKRILVYGSGDIARNFIHDNSNSVIGVLDRFEMYGSFEGMPVLTWEDIPEGFADGVVIAARQKFNREIYERILPFCTARGLEIFDISGSSLMYYFGVGKERMHAPKEALLSLDLLDQYDVVSFDVFDTLIERTVLNPVDIFDLVDIRLRNKGIVLEDFKKIRRHCELKASGPKLEDIYRQIKDFMGWNEELTVLVMAEEIECELSNIVPRKKYSDLLREAQNSGKAVFVVSDMYLSETVIRRMLEKCGITDIEEIFVSCEYLKGKGDALYEIVKDNLNGRKCIHIGDNYYLDVVMPKRYGIASMGIDAARDNLEKSAIGYSCAFSRSVTDKYILGQIASLVFQNDYKLKFNDATLLTKVFCAPFAILYIQLIIKYVRQGTYDGVLFPARDGYILKQLYDHISKAYGINVPAFYIPSSRKLMIKTGVNNDVELEYSRKYLDIVKDPIKTLFGVENSVDDGISPYENAYIHKDEIYSNVEKSRYYYTALLNGMGISLDQKYLLCEFNGQGTTQHYLSRLFENELDTVYMTHWSGVEKLKADAVYMLDNSQKQYSSMNQRFDILEFVFSSDQPSVIDIGKNGEWIFDQDPRTQEEIRLMKKMQKATVEYAVDILKRFDIFTYPVTAEMAEHILEGYNDVILEGECKLLKKDVYYDDLMKIYV